MGITQPDLEAIRETLSNIPVSRFSGYRYVMGDVSSRRVYDVLQSIPALLAYVEALEGVVREYGIKHGVTCPCEIGVHADGCDCGLTSRLAELGIELEHP